MNPIHNFVRESVPQKPGATKRVMGESHVVKVGVHKIVAQATADSSSRMI